MSLVETNNNALKAWQFKPGQIANPSGRPKGSRSKLGEAFLAAMHEDFKEHGASTIVKVREEKPDQYLKVIAMILPKQYELDGSALGQFTDEQLAQLVCGLDAWLQANGPDGVAAALGRDPPVPLRALPKANGVSPGGK